MTGLQWADLHDVDGINASSLRKKFGAKFANLAEIATSPEFSVPPGLGLSFTTVAEVDHHRSEFERFIDGVIVPRLKEIRKRAPKPERYERLIVRSSANAEDSDEAGFPGIFHSERDVLFATNEIVGAIEKVFRSTKDENVAVFAAASSISVDKIRMGCIIQWQVDAVVSGVTMTSTNNIVCDEYALMNISDGACTNVVDGRSSNEIIFSKNDRTIVNAKCRDIADLFWDGTIPFSEFSVKRPKGAWSLETMHKAIDSCIQVERRWSRPVDIEWSIDGDNNVQILQVRPIVQKVAFSLAPGM